MATRELGSIPRIRSLYPRAVAGTAMSLASRLPGLGGGRLRRLPDEELLVTGVEVDPGHLAAYCRVCGLEPSGWLPLTYPHVLAFPLQLALMTRRDFPFPVIGLVHVTNRIERLRRLAAGERLAVRVRAQALRPHERGTQFDLVSELSAGGGAPAWRSTSTYLHRESDGGGGAKRRARPEPPLPSTTFSVPRDVGRRYAAVSGDRNPIHLHPLTARAFGMPRPIAHGMWLKARVLAMLGGLVAERCAVEASFKLPLPLGTEVALSTWEEGDIHRFAVNDARTGRPHLDGSITPLQRIAAPPGG